MEENIRGNRTLLPRIELTRGLRYCRVARVINPRKKSVAQASFRLDLIRKSNHSRNSGIGRSQVPPQNHKIESRTQICGDWPTMVARPHAVLANTLRHIDNHAGPREAECLAESVM